VRNPIDRIESHYTHSRRAYWGKKIKPLHQGIDPELLEKSRYARQIEEYYHRFPRDQILILDFNALKMKPEKKLQKVCQFLEVDPDYSCQELHRVHNTNQQTIVNDKLWQSLRRVNLLRSLAQLIPSRSKNKIHLLFGRQITENFKLSPEQRNWVLNELKEDLQKLNQSYGIDIQKWEIEV
jgi:hypothetical protein